MNKILTKKEMKDWVGEAWQLAQRQAWGGEKNENERAFPSKGERMKHDHRRSLWVIGNGSVIWCYRCGAWRPNVPGRMQWHKPTGPNGKNPAMKDIK